MAKMNRVAAADAAQEGPVRLSAEGRGPKLMAWAEAHRETVEGLLHQHGAVLLPALKINGSAQFERFLTTLFDSPLLDYRNQSTPRTQLKGRIYSSTEYPPEESIPLHNENAYTHEWAMRLAFFCQLPSETGGATPIADSRRVYQRMPEAIRQRFEDRGVMYVRNYGSVDLPWQQVFQTEDPAAVEAYCENHGIEYEWRDNGGLRTREICQGTAVHPVTGDNVWFNQAHLFHISNARPEVKESLLATFGEAGLPRNAYYGDGTPFSDDELNAVREVLDTESRRFPWQLGDLMILDNMLCAHGREPYTGARRILVGMAHSHGAQTEPTGVA